MLWELLLLLLCLLHSWPCSPQKNQAESLTLTTYYNLLLCIMTILLESTLRSHCFILQDRVCIVPYARSSQSLVTRSQNADTRAHCSRRILAGMLTEIFQEYRCPVDRVCRGDAG
jgi:hypothetical protein